MKGEIFDGTKSFTLDLDEHIVEVVWRELNDELAVEIVWEALDLTGLHILLRIMYHVLLALEYASLKVITSPLNTIEQKLVQNENGFLEKGKALLWQIFNKYHISGTGIKVHRQVRKLRTESKKDKGLYRGFVIESDSTTHLMVPTETLTSSYCC